MNGDRLRTPKLSPSAGRSPTPGSKYYAGYDPRFVEDLVERLNLDLDMLVLDPWNGSGTTTTVVAQRGGKALGLDINPAMVLIAKSKLLGRDALESLPALTEEVLARARRTVVDTAGEDPLEQWFDPCSARHLRRLAIAIEILFVSSHAGLDFTKAGTLRHVSILGSSYYVVLFETTRILCSMYLASNPTWFKVKAPVGRAIHLTRAQIERTFRAVEHRHHQHLEQLTLRPADPNATVELASSSATGLDSGSVGAVITSPPYCTRIDYPVLTRPELAVLGIGKGTDMRALRDATIGTTTMTTPAVAPSRAWGKTVNAFLRSVKSHPSKASSTYYTRYFLQYFGSMHSSLTELRRVVGQDAPVAIVVQDSFYKELHLDLQSGIIEMSAKLGFEQAERHDFEVAYLRARMNVAARKYRTDFRATESLLVLR